MYFSLPSCSFWDFPLAHCRHYANQNYFYYVQQAYDPYTEGVPMEEMDLARLEYVFDPGVVNHDAIDALEPITTLPLPDSITYYTREDGRFVPAFTLEAGEEMLVFPSGKMTNSRTMPATGIRAFPLIGKAGGMPGLSSLKRNMTPTGQPIIMLSSVTWKNCWSMS